MEKAIPGNTGRNFRYLKEKLFNTTELSLEQDKTQFDILNLSQELRCRLSTQAFILVLLVAIVYTWSLWDRTNTKLLLMWSIAITITAAHRAWYSRGLLKNASNPTPAQLISNETYLFINGVIYGILIGAGFWLIASQSDDRTVSAITLMSCMYAIGTTVNSSVHFRTFTIFTLLNLGQGILFFGISVNKNDIPIMLSMIVIVILLLRFGHKNSELFANSVKRRLENVEQNEKLIQHQLEMKRAFDTVNEANLSKGRFISAAAHDLRQPHHALSLFLGSLKNTETSEEQKKLLHYIQQSSDTITAQFNSLLDLSRYDSGSTEANIVKFDLHHLLQRMVESMSLQAEEKKLVLTYVGEPISLQSDPILLERVVRNLTTNALKFTQTGSVKISSELIGDEAIVSVIDTGIGIAKADQSSIFSEFTQVGNPERSKNKGVGLGLAIVSRITTLLNIRISVESQLGQGSTFTLKIPHRKVAQATTNHNLPSTTTTTATAAIQLNEDNTASAVGSSGAISNTNTVKAEKAIHSSNNDTEKHDSASDKLVGITFLLVDDDELNLKAFEQFLVSQGATVIACQSHAEAIETAIPNTIDFAFLDDMLAGTGSGLDIANWLAGYVERERIVLVTGSEKPERIREIRSAGFAVYTKPLTSSQLNSIFISRLVLLKTI